MGGCAGCMGPDRRADNYKVNRLTENSPIKSRLSSSELPVNRNRDKIYEDVNQSKKKLGPNNLIATLINSTYDLNKSPQQNSNNRLMGSFYASPESANQVYLRDSYLSDTKQKRNSMLLSKKYDSHMYIDENITQSKMMAEMPKPVLSQLKSTYMKPNQSFRMNQELFNSKNYKSSIQDNRSINKMAQFSKFTKKGLLNIPELSDQDSKTPQYVKQIRKQNGQDIQRTYLQNIPRKIQTAQPLNLFKYLKDLK